MEAFSALLDFCEGNSPVTGKFPLQTPVTRSFDVFFDLRLNKRLDKQWRRRWLETPSRSLWYHRNEFGVQLCPNSHNKHNESCHLSAIAGVNIVVPCHAVYCKVSATPLQISSTGAQSSNELQCLEVKAGYPINSLRSSYAYMCQ